MAFVNRLNVNNTEVNREFKRTSSLNKYYICGYCDKQFDIKFALKKHVETCLIIRTCTWCNITFKNRGNLARHSLCVHGDKSYIEEESNTEEKNENVNEEDTIMKLPPTKLILKSAIKPRSVDNSCVVCCQTFPDFTRLVYHIRSLHFNLKAKMTGYEDKEINQVWFEKVYNTSQIVEIKKARHNQFLIRKMDDIRNISVEEYDEVDLSYMYPTRIEGTLGKCKICHQTLLKRDLKKHYDERHMQIQKHHCNNCNRSFKRSVAYVRHVCNKQKRRRKLIL